MELVSGLLIWAADVSGVKWVREEKNPVKKAVKAAVFLVAGVILVMTTFVLLYS